ncbi:MAG: flagellar basal body P-ring protein FlgI, partial [Planctomycetota bacterium]|nr:flagellar basal body P-ring protein FlgI [Planctomycetota bacterium]
MTQQLLSMLGGAPRRRRLAAFAALAMASAIAGSLLHGCGSSPPKRARAVTPELAIRDMPNILRGTVGAEATLRGLNPTLVTGYGIVVGLNGTGSSDIPVAVRAMLEQEMARRGVGSESQGLGWTTPTRMLNDPNTAVVLVRAAIPPGSPVGTRFDVLVTALPGTSTTSLEGGRLWSTDLRRGNQAPGGPDVPAIATATGDVFINPFADPAGDDTAGVSRTTGRILNGGVVSEALELALILDNPSHARSRSIVAAINSRFPQGRGDRDPVARGVNEEVVLLTVPNRFRSDTETFLELVLASRVDVSAGQEWARRYTMAMKSEPELSEDLAWRLRALGDVSVPFLRDLYAYPEILPRIQALRAGAGLGDPLVTPHLMDLARDGAPALRTEAIELLAGMGPDPQINTALRKMLDDDNLGVRIAAYEALAS